MVSLGEPVKDGSMHLLHLARNSLILMIFYVIPCGAQIIRGGERKVTRQITKAEVILGDCFMRCHDY
jgi:hypothetical protein